jgi:hypothetical protein
VSSAETVPAASNVHDLRVSEPRDFKASGRIKIDDYRRWKYRPSERIQKVSEGSLVRPGQVRFKDALNE